MDVLRTKSVEQSIQDTDDPDRGLRRALGPVQLTALGIGVIIGTGIFVLTGEAAGTIAGPAIALSFVAAAIACALAALCYAEFASTVPVAGSAYTFSYASLGELVAWIIGWDLMLELAFGAATVASGWSQYFQVVLQSAPFHAHPPAWIFADHHNLMAAVPVLVLTGLLCFGIKASSSVNAVIVAIKVVIVLVVIFAGLSYIHSGNYHPFIPPSGSKPAPGGSSETTLIQSLGAAPGAFGVSGIFAGAALVFFAFIGFDIVATNAEESKKPQRDLPIGIFASLIICTILYVAVSLVVTGMVKYNKIDVKAPLATAFQSVGQNTIATIVSWGALFGITSVILVLLMGQARVFFAMSRDGLLPPVFSRVSARYGSPYRTTLVTGVAVAALTFFFPLKTLAELVNIGTLFAFVLVALGVIFLRRSRPDLERPFRTPMVPLVPILSVLASVWLMLNLASTTWIRFGVWLVVGLIIYFGYSYRHSRLARGEGGPEGTGRGDAGGRERPARRQAPVAN
ncbi:MAG TPA: amino acid permease [Solirubrobacteraceae bacterium]|jgi:APA family basic amino acid/polyamine antiporter